MKDFEMCLNLITFTALSIYSLIYAIRRSSKDSGWKHIRKTSSMCSGMLTAEMGFAVNARTINDSAVFPFTVDFKLVAIWDFSLT